MTVGLRSFTNFCSLVLTGFLIMLVTSTPVCLAKGQRTQKSQEDFSERDRNILENGKISPVRHILGGILSFLPGFGVGHAVEGRWSSRGWIFTAGELITAPLIFDKSSKSFGLIAALGFVGLRYWEIADAIGGPFSDNSRYDDLHNRYEITSNPRLNIMPVPMLSQNAVGKTTIAPGLGLRWTLD